MKRNVFFTIVAIFAIQLGYAQVPITVDFNSTNTGRSINVLVSKQFGGRHELGGGIRFNINKRVANDDQHCIFRKRMFATKPLHYFGIEGFYQIHFLQSLEHLDLFAFYDIQYCYSTNIMTPDPAYANYIYAGPYHWLEHNIGIGFTVNIWKNLFFTQRLGGGGFLVLGKGDNNANAILLEQYLHPCSFEFGYLFSTGIGYRF